MNFGKEIEDLITMHNVLREEDDFYYASHMKDWIQGIKWRMRKERNLKKNEQNTEKLAEGN